jgi:hypothetical protein
MMAMNRSNVELDTKILLIQMPFLTPLNPPLGIACLKGYLNRHGYGNVKSVDTMAVMTLREKVYEYYKVLESFIPADKKGNFYNVGFDVLINHFVAHINQNAASQEVYHNLVREMIYLNFYVRIDQRQVDIINEVLNSFYQIVEAYIINLMQGENPGVIGISVIKGSLAASLYAFKVIKQNFPHIMTIMGGPVFSQELHHNSPNFQRFLENEYCRYIDHILIGEGENLLLQLLKGSMTERKKVYSLDDINCELVNLEESPLPDFTDYDLPLYAMIPSYTSRGCPYRCSFCAETVYWIRYRNKAAKKIADEFDFLSKKYNRRLFVLADSIINFNVTELSKELVRRNIKVYWDVFLKVDQASLSLENTFLWRRGGFYRARLGAESGSQRILDIIGKKITVKESKETVYNLATAGIKTTVYMIMGHPGETEEDFQQTLDYLTEMQDYIYEAECNPFRYYYSGQSHGDIWEDKRRLLYPKEATDLLMTEAFYVATQPSRQVIYERVCRFVEHCDMLGIPNPYSVSDIYKADERWKMLQRNAVLSVFEVNNNEVLHEPELVYPVKITNEAMEFSDNENFGF